MPCFWFDSTHGKENFSRVFSENFSFNQTVLRWLKIAEAGPKFNFVGYFALIVDRAATAGGVLDDVDLEVPYKYVYS